MLKLEGKVRQEIIQPAVLAFSLFCLLPAYGEQLTRVSVDTPLAISDNNSNGITSVLEINSNSNVVSAIVQIDITHSYIGDLTIHLLCPAGGEAILQSRTGGDTDNINRSYQFSTCNGQAAQGSWRLVISDHANLDIGSLQQWELKLELSSPNSNQTPQAHAGNNFSVPAGQTGILNGSASSDPNGDTLLFSWIQTKGPPISLSSQQTSQPTFVAPALTEDTILTFNLTVSDGMLSSQPDEVALTILANVSGWNQIQASNDTPLAIPDTNITGVTSTLNFLSSEKILAGEVMVSISHTYIGDLKIRLQCPSGTEIQLHNRSGGGTDNLIAAFPLNACHGQSAAGNWQMIISDHASQDIGFLNAWEIRLNLGAQEVWDVNKTSTNTALSIPDNNLTGITSEITVSTIGQVVEAEVQVDISHTYISDLQLILRCPNGAETVLHNRTGGSTDDIHSRYTVTACNSQSTTGTWQLILIDNAAQDSGILTEWTLRLKTGLNAPPLFQVQDIESWYLIGNALTPGQNELSVRIQASNYTGTVYAQLDNNTPVSLSAVDSIYSGSLDISNLGSGQHKLHLTTNVSNVSIADLTFMRTHPLYVIVSNDWDSSDNSDVVLRRQEQLHADHPELKLTHFVGPYTFTDSAVSIERRAFLVEWLTNLRDNEGDEIGLHIHPYCTFVNTVESVNCRHQPSYTMTEGDTTGYTVLSSAYTEAEYLRLLTAAKALFEANNLGTPVSFRAGGWAADLGVMKALAAAGFVADSSANNWARLDEWEDFQNGVLFKWNRQNWSSIGDTSQPYYPSPDNILLTSNNALNILEVPDNGSLVDYVSSAEMIEIFQNNWSGAALTQPIAYTIGYHPINYSSNYHRRIQLTLDHIDQHLASQHQGPVVYEILRNLTRVWQK